LIPDSSTTLIIKLFAAFYTPSINYKNFFTQALENEKNSSYLCSP